MDHIQSNEILQGITKQWETYTLFACVVHITIPYQSVSEDFEHMRK